jgi:diguanylate cyclase (GGDEF)-like protein
MSESQKNSEDFNLERIAEESSLAIVIADGQTEPIDGANNNSMCRALYSSAEFAPRCAEFCGRAFEWANEAKKTVAYECHAGLSCLAVPLNSKATEEKSLVSIVGRTFLKAANYRAAAERAAAGDWRQFPPIEFFENVLLTGSAGHLGKLAARLEKLSLEDKLNLKTVEKTSIAGNLQKSSEISKTQPGDITKLIEQFHRGISSATEKIEQSETVETGKSEQNTAIRREKPEEISAWRSLFGSILTLEYKQAYAAILKFLQSRYDLKAVVWLERKENRLETVLSIGEMRQKHVEIAVAADDERLLDAAQREIALELRERDETNSIESRQSLYLFPISVGGEIRSALAVNGELDEKIKRRLARFCRTIASELEILRLREELSRRDWLRRIVDKFNASLKKIDADDFWFNLTQISAELMRAERASLLFFNEKDDLLQAKAVIGSANDLSGKEIGSRVARTVLRNGKPLVVGEISEIGIAAAPSDWKYQTDSFISYPIALGERKIAVLNFTDRADRVAFGDLDLELMQAIAPQIAVAIDRAALKEKAGEFEQLSVTDDLTGLVNIRYLNERLTEEIKRSERHGFPMSFMMIDVDDFKSYNDSFGHPEGDRALKLVGALLKEGLRGADVAARYGGEEFSILLPQTTCEEAVTIAERIRRRVEETVFPNRKITISIGVACSSAGLNTSKKLIKAADKALYEAKRRGRNNVQSFDNLTKSQNGE